MEAAATSPSSGHSDVLQVLLDVPQRPGAGLQLGHLIIRQGHIDHAGHAPGVQHARKTQVHLFADSVHTLCDKQRQYDYRQQPTLVQITQLVPLLAKKNPKLKRGFRHG